MWKTVHNNFHIVNIRMKSCSLKKSTLFTSKVSYPKVVHLRFPFYQHPHTKLLIKNFHIIDIHRKSCLLKNFHFIKTHKQFFFISTLSISTEKLLQQFWPLCHLTSSPWHCRWPRPAQWKCYCMWQLLCYLAELFLVIFLGSSLQTICYIFTDQFRKVTIECFLKRIILHNYAHPS